jgi:cytochrome c oxidase cbb3-type subunit III
MAWKKMRGTFNGMNFLRSALRWSVRLAALFLMGFAVSAAQTPTPTHAPTQTPQTAPVSKSYPPALIESGSALFRKDCSFCHGRDAGGGETGPDLTRSKLVTADVGGSKIGAVVRSGRPEKGMPHFDVSNQQIAGLAAFIHTQRKIALAQKGGRRGVDVSDLQTGNVEAGRQYFDGAGGCASCHSPTGDLAGIASRRKGLELEMWMLYPERAKSKVTVTLASGEAIAGTLAYRDEFTIALRDATGVYRSWRTSDVQYKLDAPVDAHVDLLSKYTDDDIHNLMAYLQTLR